MQNKSLVPSSGRAGDNARVGRENQVMVHRTLDRHSRGIFSSIPDLASRKLSKSHLRKELEKGFEYRLKRLSLELDTDLHQVREESNHILVNTKTQLRRERMEFFARSYNEVMERFNDLTERFLTRLDERLQRLDRYKSPVIREREEQRLSRSIDIFIATLDQLVEEYRSIISEQVNHE